MRGLCLPRRGRVLLRVAQAWKGCSRAWGFSHLPGFVIPARSPLSHCQDSDHPIDEAREVNFCLRAPSNRTIKLSEVGRTLWHTASFFT